MNLATGAAYADLGATPMVLVTGQKPIKRRRQARFQVVGIVATMTRKPSRQLVSGPT